MMKQTYQAASNQLDEIIQKLQQPGIPADEAVGLYKKGLELIKTCETLLDTSENTIAKLALQAETPKK